MSSGQTFQMRLIFLFYLIFFFFKFKYLQYHVLAGVLWSNLSSASNIFKISFCYNFSNSNILQYYVLTGSLWSHLSSASIFFISFKFKYCTISCFDTCHVVTLSSASNMFQFYLFFNSNIV